MLLVKIIIVSVLIIYIYVSFELIKLLPLWIFTFVFVIFVFVMEFHSYIQKFLYKLRDGLFGIIIPLTDYDKRFKDYGGIDGFENIEEKHIAFVFPEVDERVYPSVDSKEKKMLYNFINENGGKYKLYFCNYCEDFENIVKSEYVTGLHIFGHGSISHLTFKDGVVMYREFYGLEPKKEFVCQWHCNIGKYKDIHLGHIAKRYYVKEGYRHYFNNKKDIKKLIDGRLDWTINTNQ